MIKKTLFVLFIVSLIGCYKLNSGIVIHKEFVAEHSQSYYTYIYTGKTSIPVPHTRTVPDSWYITIEGAIKGKTRTKTFAVSKDEYKSMNIGEFIYIK